MAAAIPLSSLCGKKSIDFDICFYFVYCYETDGEASASSFSSAVDGYGGAAYTLEYGGRYYIAAACYYSYADAEAVCKNLNTLGVSCGALTAERKAYPLTTRNAIKQAKTYKGIITTLYELSTIIYACANGLDTGEYSSSAIKDIMQSVKKNLCFLTEQNEENCFYNLISQVLYRCDECIENTYSKYLRATQIAIADILLNITLT
ncbi:MAG: hypothetical protein LUD27_08240 [Clostridia bacterium]|nr:hypothetical protein [Clostridia bacterium]